jgi:tRNA threonylcarbamoyladenosine biosynthesis protein TsaE
MEKQIRTLEELQAEAEAFVSTLTPKGEGATLVTLSGELGAGKTAFTKAVAQALGISDAVTSPTFVLEKIYLLSGKAFSRLIHIDAYRLNSGSELSPLGFSALMSDAGNLVVLEWPEKVTSALPTPAVRISLQVEENGARRMIYG